MSPRRDDASASLEFKILAAVIRFIHDRNDRVKQFSSDAKGVDCHDGTLGHRVGLSAFCSATTKELTLYLGLKIVIACLKTFHQFDFLQSTLSWHEAKMHPAGAN